MGPLTLFGIPVMLLTFRPLSLQRAAGSLALAAMMVTNPLAGQTIRPDYVKRIEKIRMRDGVQLYTEILTPANQSGPLPMLMERTPYDATLIGPKLADRYKVLADEGYIFITQDIRGKFQSDGTFMMIRPPRDPKRGEQVDEGTDTNDTIDWLLKNVPNNNGRVGMVGISYGGWLTMMALVEPHPALKAASPQASPDDMYLGDDFHHNGAFRLSYGFEYVASLEAGKISKPFEFDRLDGFEWFLRLGGLANADAKYFKGQRPSWTDFVNHPNFDEYWKRRKVSPVFATKPVTVPTLTVGGWWDQEDFFGPITIYDAMEPNDTKGINYMVLGPWNHGGWGRGDGASLGPIQFGSNTSEWFRQSVEGPWFAYWLKDKGKLDLPEVLTFRAGDNTWQRHSVWPPKDGVRAKQLYFLADGRLGWDKPSGGTAAFDSWISDPNRPVPYRRRPINPLEGVGNVPSTWRLWLVDDQRHADLRPDVLSFETEPLADKVTITGRIAAKLFASTTGTDADWVVKLIDVYPENYVADPSMAGYQLMVANDVIRARFRSSFEHPTPVVPNRIVPYTVDLHEADYTFLKGHRIMVQVQSTWFPLIDRNPQKFVPNIFLAKDADFIKATHRVYRSAAYPSHIEVSVAER
ncbi:MAG: CocE/NonD family hydrolase [Gemmatimonadota bacterium]